MTTAEKNKLIRDTLNVVNKVRKATGRKPLARMPKGNPGEAASCPIATALNSKFEVEVSGRDFELANITPKQAQKVLDALDSRSTPEASEYSGRYFFIEKKVFEKFVTEFDSGNIQELVK